MRQKCLVLTKKSLDEPKADARQLFDQSSMYLSFKSKIFFPSIGPNHCIIFRKYTIFICKNMLLSQYGQSDSDIFSFI